jgi:hypothetical protein
MNHARCKRYPRYLTVVYRYRPGVSVGVAKSNVMINKVISSNQDTFDHYLMTHPIAFSEQTSNSRSRPHHLISSHLISSHLIKHPS